MPKKHDFHAPAEEASKRLLAGPVTDTVDDPDPYGAELPTPIEQGHPQGSWCPHPTPLPDQLPTHNQAFRVSETERPTSTSPPATQRHRASCGHQGPHVAALAMLAEEIGWTPPKNSSHTKVTRFPPRIHTQHHPQEVHTCYALDSLPTAGPQS